MLYSEYVVTVANREECKSLEPVELQNLLDQVLEGCAGGYLAEVRGADADAGADEDGGTEEHFAQGADCEQGNGTDGTHGTHGTDAGEDTADGTPVECGAQDGPELPPANLDAALEVELDKKLARAEDECADHAGGDAALAPDVPQWVENLRLRVANQTMSIYEFRRVLCDCRLKAVHVCRFAGIDPAAYSTAIRTGKLYGPDRKRLLDAFGVEIATGNRK